MKIKLKNLGSIKQAEFELGDFTIIFENDTGKVYRDLTTNVMALENYNGCYNLNTNYI